MAGVPYRDWWKPAPGLGELTGEAFVTGPVMPMPPWAAHYVDIPEKPAVRKGKLRVFVTMPALCCFVRNVAGDLVDVRMQKPNGSFTFQNTTWSSGENEAEMFNSDLVVWNGLGIDSWIERQQRMMGPARRFEAEGGRTMIQKVPVKLIFPDRLDLPAASGPGAGQGKSRPIYKVVDVEVTGSGRAGTVSVMGSGTTVEMRARETSFLMASDGITAREHRVPWELFTLAPGKGLPPGGRAPEGRNPYVWLDPMLAVREVENIRDGLIRADPIHRFLYIGKANAYLQRLRALDAEARTVTGGVRRRRLLGVGDEFGYFLRRYGIEQTGVYYPNIGGVWFDRDAVGYFRQLMEERPSDGMILARNALTDEARRAFADLGLPMAELDPMETGDGGVDFYERVTRANLGALGLALK
jgi:ABC-type Zn uptake system ZnuABC Zn-binding protein ZnuA